MSKRVSRFTIKDSEQKEVVYIVKFPTRQQQHKAQLASIKAFNEARGAGAVPRERLNQYLVDQKLWDVEKQKRLEELSKQLLEGERQLARGGRTKDGKKFSKEDAKKLAIDMRIWRLEQLLLLAKSRELDRFTLESQAENANFDCLVSECTYYEDGSRVFENMEDYVARAEEEYASKAAIELSNMMYSMDDDYEKRRPENQFLIKYGFARDTDLHLTNEKGQLIDSEGRFVNEDGRLINEDNQFIDVNGNFVDKDGNPVEEFTPFEDDEEKVEVASE